MQYDNIRKALFVNRPNRFIANIELDGHPLVCHVKNTGRCKELLTPKAHVLVQMVSEPSRKTPCDLIAVWKNSRLINMDSQAPNKIFGEWLQNGGLGFVPDLIKPEHTYNDSRFDFYFEQGEKRHFAEVKGVTLENDGIAAFPDAPTERGIKHINGLIQAHKQGYETWIVFIIQMQDVKHFEPNWNTHKAFGDALKLAKQSGVNILALDCTVSESTIFARKNVPVFL